MKPTPCFDSLAKVYWPLEYLFFGSRLARTRNYFLPRLQACRRALVIGDGDGRFLAHLLIQNPLLEAEVVDLSPGMLAELRRRCASQLDRLTLHCTDALQFQSANTFELVVTHFFLDCLTPAKLTEFVPQVAARMQPGALWVVSEFHIPAHGLKRHFARVLVRSLYLAFRILAGLRVTRLPDHARVFREAGLHRVACHDRCFGMLRSELWSL